MTALRNLFYVVTVDNHAFTFGLWTAGTLCAGLLLGHWAWR